MPQKRTPTIARYLAKVSGSEEPEACWNWTGAKDQDGYGIFWDGTYRTNGRGHYVRVTRWTHEQFIGPIPAGKQLLHRCDNPSCVNPGHFFTGSAADNHADREQKGRGSRAHGSAHVGSKLTEADVIALRAASAAGQSGNSLARQYGITSAQTSNIIRRKVWRHI